MPKEEYIINERAPSEPLPVGILGGTGIVGQRLVSLLEGHPWFRVAVVGASATSVGRPYGSIKWRMDYPPQIPPQVASLIIQPCEPSFFEQCAWIFSALDSETASKIEPQFRDAGFLLFTNSAAFRLSPSVPLVVPTANPHPYMEVLIERQRQQQTMSKSGSIRSGLIVANSNCTTSGVAVVLKALMEVGMEPAAVMAHSLQAISGAGISPGLAAFDIHDNVIPFIAGEENKLVLELQRMLDRPHLPISASCNRVMVTDGHTVNLAIKFVPSIAGEKGGENKQEDPRPLSNNQAGENQEKLILANRVSDALRSYQPLGCSKRWNLPSHPQEPIHLFDPSLDADRPQPKLDRMLGGGMSVLVGRIRPCEVMDVKMTILLNNTILGAAGSALLNAEIAYRLGALD